MSELHRLRKEVEVSPSCQKALHALYRELERRGEEDHPYVKVFAYVRSRKTRKFWYHRPLSDKELEIVEVLCPGPYSAEGSRVLDVSSPYAVLDGWLTLEVLRSFSTSEYVGDDLRYLWPSEPFVRELVQESLQDGSKVRPRELFNGCHGCAWSAAWGFPIRGRLYAFQRLSKERFAEVGEAIKCATRMLKSCTAEILQVLEGCDECSGALAQRGVFLW